MNAVIDHGEDGIAAKTGMAMAAPQAVGEGFECIAPAKVNLWLRVTGRRHDGFHLLDSLVVFVSVADTISVRPAAESKLTVSGPYAPGLSGAPDDNIVLRSADLMAKAAGERATPLSIHLSKVLPVASGIGGGSADAAAVIRCLARLWNIDVPAGAENNIVTLGADVPMCVRSATAFVSGIGDALEPGPAALSGLGVLLVNPGQPVSTPAVFKARTGAFSDPVTRPDPGAGTDAHIAAIAAAGNDLEAPASRICPEIVKVLGALDDQADILHAGLSGSGATCFGLFHEKCVAEAAGQAVAAAHPSWWCRAGVIL